MTYLNWELVRSCLTELSQPDFREKLWLAELPGMQGSFDECAEELFGDSGLLDALNGDLLEDPALHRKFRQLESVLDAIAETHGQNYWARDVLGDSRMPEVTRLARNLLRDIPVD